MIVLTLGIALTYAGSLATPFIFDDVLSVVQNGTIQHLWSWRVFLPPYPSPVSGRPLVNLSLALNYAVGGFDVVGYHAVNLALHVANAILVYAVLRLTLDRVAEFRRLPAKPATVAFAAALLWGVHPLTSEVVDYVTQRTESMMALFYLAALLASIYAFRKATSPVWQTIAVLLAMAAMACKETAVTLPLIVVLFDAVFLFGGFAAALKARWRFYVALASTLLLQAALELRHGQDVAGGLQTARISSWNYLLDQTVMIVHYLRLVVWPVGLVLDYGWAHPVPLGAVWPDVAVCVVLVAGTLVLLIRKPMLGFGAAWVLVTLAPSSSVVPVATEVGAERRMYLPLVAVVALSVLGAATLFGRRSSEPDPPASSARRPSGARTPRSLTRVVPGLCLAGLAIALSIPTASRSREYASPLTMAETLVARWPTPSAQHHLGNELAAEGRHTDAIEHLQRAAESMAPARYDLGRELLAVGRYDEAIAQFRAFIRLEPKLLATRNAYLLWATALDHEGRSGEAVEEIQAVLAASPDDAEAHGMLADLLAEQNAFVDAIPHYRAYLAVRPTDARAWTGLGIALARSGQQGQATAAFRQAVEIEPANGHYRQNLGRALLEASAASEAAAEAQRAVGIAPGDPAAHVLLGDALAAEHRLDEARREYERALQLAPAYPPAVEALRAAGGRRE